MSLARAQLSGPLIRTHPIATLRLQHGSDRQPVFDAIEAVVELVAQIAEITYRIFRRLTGARQGAEKR